MEKAKIKKKDYQSYYDVIVTDQCPPEAIAYYFTDLKFLKYWKKKKFGDGGSKKMKKSEKNLN